MGLKEHELKKQSFYMRSKKSRQIMGKLKRSLYGCAEPLWHQEPDLLPSYDDYLALLIVYTLPLDCSRKYRWSSGNYESRLMHPPKNAWSQPAAKSMSTAPDFVKFLIKWMLCVGWHSSPNRRRIEGHTATGVCERMKKSCFQSPRSLSFLVHSITYSFALAGFWQGQWYWNFFARLWSW